jgi:hypothetical protein
LVLPVYTVVLASIATVVITALIQQDWTEYDWAGFPGEIGDVLFTDEWWGTVAFPTLVIVASQVVFLIPMVSRRPPRGERPRSLKVSLVLAGGVAAAITIALVMVVVEAISQWPKARWIDHLLVEATLLVLAMGSWFFWSGVLLVFTRGIWADRILGRVVGLLVAGTVLELLVVVPLDIMVRRRSDCYCWTGTFFALCLSVSATLWLAGPGVVIALFAKRHRLWRETHCERCGYPRSDAGGPKCPECGLEWPGRPPLGGRTPPSS